MVMLKALGVSAQNMCITNEHKICSSGSLRQWVSEMCELGLELVGYMMNSLLEQNTY
jgi:hypothetical protein